MDCHCFFVYADRTTDSNNFMSNCLFTYSHWYNTNHCLTVTVTILLYFSFIQDVTSLSQGSEHTPENLSCWIFQTEGSWASEERTSSETGHKTLIWEVSSLYLEERKILIFQDTGIQRGMNKQWDLTVSPSLLSSCLFFPLLCFPMTF